MSFSSKVKNEICRSVKTKPCCAIAEIYGVLLYANTFSPDILRIVTENRAFAARADKLMQSAFGFGFDNVLGDISGEGKLTLEITDSEYLETLLDKFGYSREGLLAHHINLGVLEEECCRVSFVRGAFLAGGSVTDPEKAYHLEFVTSHYNVAREIYSLFLELGSEPGSVARGGNNITYFKHSETIEELLTRMGAPVSAMDIMNAKVEKEMRNSVNRKVNCDTANLEKMVEAAMKQNAAIEKLEQNGALKSMGERFVETARLRKANPDASLAELAEMFDPPVTKSCLSHRLNKIIETANQGEK